METISIKLWSGIFIATLTIGICFTIYIRKAAQGKPYIAGVWSVMSFVLSAFVVYEYVHNPWTLVPAVFGDFLGTILVIRWDTNIRLPTCKLCDQGRKSLSRFPHGRYLVCPDCRLLYWPDGNVLFNDRNGSPILLDARGNFLSLNQVMEHVLNFPQAQ